MRDWETDLKKSNQKFVDVVYPQVEESFFNGEGLIPVETETTDVFYDIMDQKAGIDFWYVEREGNGMWGLGNRVQWTDKAWNTFTVRKERSTGSETEYGKRKRQIEEGLLYPKYMCHSYIDSSDNFLSSALVKTKDIIEYIDNGEEGYEYTVRKTTHRKGFESFFVVNWLDLKNNDVDVEIEE